MTAKGIEETTMALFGRGGPVELREETLPEIPPLARWVRSRELALRIRGADRSDAAKGRESPTAATGCLRGTNRGPRTGQTESSHQRLPRSGTDNADLV